MPKIDIHNTMKSIKNHIQKISTIAIRRIIYYISWPLQHFMLVQVIVAIISLYVFYIIWGLSGISSQPVDVFVKTATSLLPALAITNAIPLLGASSYLSRHNSSDKTAEILSELSEIAGRNYERLDAHPRENVYARSSRYKTALNKFNAEHYTFKDKDGEMIYVIRPWWDGIWYFGKTRGELDYITRKSHEMVFCAHMALRHIDRLRRSGAALVFRSGNGGTAGSENFLGKIKSSKKLILNRHKTISKNDAQTLTLLAMRSWHYMGEELRDHRTSSIRDEHNEAVFGVIFCEYLMWLNYFHMKAAEIRIVSARDHHPAMIEKLAEKLDELFEKHNCMKDELREVRTTLLGRRSIAERITQVRFGAIIPIAFTASSLIGYAIMNPLAYGTSNNNHMNIIAFLAYALGSTAMISNFLFGLWFLLPIRRPKTETIAI